jgi:hypothetical protein
MLFIVDFFWFLLQEDGLCENGHGNKQQWWQGWQFSSFNKSS